MSDFAFTPEAIEALAPVIARDGLTVDAEGVIRFADGRIVQSFFLGHIPVSYLCPHHEKWSKCGVCNPEEPEDNSLEALFGWGE